MAKNLVKNNKQPVAMEMGARDMEAMAKSPNLEKDAAYMAPLKNNAMREKPHMGAMPPKGSGKF